LRWSRNLQRTVPGRENGGIEMATEPGGSPRRRRPFYYPYPVTIAGCLFWLVFLLATGMVIVHFWSGRAT
jgi:hypothetical protein